MASRSSIFSLRSAAAVSAGVAAAGIALHSALPWMAAFLLSEGPRMYGTLHSWLAPPYLYFVVNGIIISIAAASCFQKAEDDEVIAGSAVSEQDPAVFQPEFESDTVEYESKIEEQSPPPIDFTEATEEYQGAVKVEEEGEGEDEFVISRSSWSPKRRDSTEISPEYSSVPEKPLVSVRFGHRKSIKASPEGRALRVARPKRNETLESTWKAITDGRAVPLARHLKKSDTWGDVHCRVRDDEAVAVMRKCETLNDRVSRPLLSPAATPGKLKRDPSLGQDDLNRRVEAFIKKFNEEMRLQRQESFKQYKDMIHKGSG